MKEAPQILQTQTVYSSKTFSVREDRVRQNGREHTWSIVEHPGAYAILAQPDAASVLLVRQYRQAAGRELLEIPAGTASPGETPAQGGAARACRGNGIPRRPDRAGLYRLYDAGLLHRIDELFPRDGAAAGPGCV